MAENEDTEKGLTDFVPFKNLFNEWYAKDTSRKIKAALHAKFAAGEHTCTYAPLGYRKDPDVRSESMNSRTGPQSSPPIMYSRRSRLLETRMSMDGEVVL